MRPLNEYPHSQHIFDANYLLIPVTQFDLLTQIDEFNEVYRYIRSHYDKALERTRSGGLKKPVRLGYDVRATQTSIEVTLVCGFGSFRFQFRSKKPETKYSGHRAFLRFKRELLADGVDLNGYAIANGAEVKSTIEKPMVAFARPSVQDLVFDRAWHIDFHSAYPAGLAETHSEFRPTIERIYSKKERGDQDCKAVLNFAIGYMQSIGGCGARWSHLSRDAIARSNAKLRELTGRIEEWGGLALLYNTDGIWYQSPGHVPYHGAGEGRGLGQWHNDKGECRFRAKSPGAYEYIDSLGVYHPVVRGVPQSVSSAWSWGGIYTKEAEPPIICFSEERGVFVK